MASYPRALVVEDEQIVSDILYEILCEDYEVIAVTTATAALVELTAQPFDVVLLDYGLPDGNGQDVARHASQMGVAVVWMTGSSEKARALSVSVRPVLLKPFSIPQVLNALSTACGLR
jgi:CheY-like chemotaxis protein